MLLADWEIRALCVEKGWDGVGQGRYMRTGDGGPVQFTDGFEPMLEPFSEAVSGDGVVSYGLTSAGYDLRLAEEIWVCKNTHSQVVDVCRMKEPGYCEKIYDRLIVHPTYDLPPHSYILGRSLERFQMPRHLVGRVTGKSTLARAGVLVNVTPIEPRWKGFLTIEIANTSPSPVRLYINQGIAQVQFELIHRSVETDYEQKDGKYQRQVGVTPGFVK